MSLGCQDVCDGSMCPVLFFHFRTLEFLCSRECCIGKKGGGGGTIKSGLR